MEEALEDPERQQKERSKQKSFMETQRGSKRSRKYWKSFLKIQRQQKEQKEMEEFPEKL